MIDNALIVPYLVVLNHKSVIDKLTSDEIKFGNQNMLGCLHKLEDEIRKSGNTELLNMLLERERLNAIHPVGQPDLQKATEDLANSLYKIYLQAFRID